MFYGSGGPESGVPGRGALGKVMFAGAVELDESGFDRARVDVIPNVSAVSLAAFLDVIIEPGSRVITTAGRPTLRLPETVTSRLPPRWPSPAWPRTKCGRRFTGSSPW